LKIYQDEQNIYAKQQRMYKKFQMGEHVYLHIMSRKSSLNIESCVKLAPSFCEPFQILERVRTLAYRLYFPSIMKAHDVFHISLLKNYVHVASHVFDWSYDADGIMGRIPTRTTMISRS